MSIILYFRRNTVPVVLFSQRFIFTDITSSRTLRLNIPQYSHKKIRLAEIISSFAHANIDRMFNGIELRSRQNVEEHDI